MREPDHLAEVEMLAAKARGRWPQWQLKINEWTRGGFPGSSVPEAITSSSDGSPALLSDRIDQRLTADRKRARRLVLSLRRDMLELDRLLDGWLTVAPRLPDDVPCVNFPDCKNLVPPDGRDTCARCRVHKHRHGVRFPFKQEFGEAVS